MLSNKSQPISLIEGLEFAANQPISLLKTPRERRLDSLVLNLSYCLRFPELGMSLIKYYLAHSAIAVDYFAKKSAENSLDRNASLNFNEKVSIQKLQRTLDVDRLTNDIQAFFPRREQTVVNTTQMLIEFGTCFNFMLGGERPESIAAKDLMTKTIFIMIREYSCTKSSL
jgi:hypothetical protein